MIKDEVIAKKYADAFLAYAKEGIGFDRGLEELQDAKRIIRDNPDFKKFLEGLEITNPEKYEVIDRVFTEGFSEEIRHLLKFLLKKRRIGMFENIAEYARVTYSHGIEIDALLKTTYPLDTELIARIKTSLENKLKKKLHLFVELDSNLLGGIYVKVENIIIDGSVRRRLEELKEKLTVLKVA